MDKAKELLLVAGVFFLVMFPYIWKGQDVQVNVWDNLDSNVVWYKMLKDQGKIFAGPEVMVQGFVTETPRFSYPSGWNVELFLVYFFDVFTAYWINKLLVFLIAFVSMFYFLKNEVKDGAAFFVGLSLVWATLAFYPHRGISIAALPLIFTLFNQLREGLYFKRGLFLISCYALYSMFVLAGLYVWIIFVFISAYWMIRDRRWMPHLIAGLALWISVYMVVDYQLFYAFFLQNNFVSHRAEMVYKISIWSEMYPWDFLMGRDHAGVFYWQGYFWLASVFAGLHLVRSKSRNSILLFFASLALIIAVCCSMISLFSWMDWAGKVFSSLHSLNLLRFSFFLPFALIAVVVIGLSPASLAGKKWLILFFLGINVFIYQYEWRNLINGKISVLPYKVPTYREYFASSQYDELKNYLGEDVYKMTFGHINLPPAVSAYNGLRAVDGYLQNYSLDYKHSVRKVIEGELMKDKILASHFDNWGNKCYLQNATYPDMFDLYKWKKMAPIEQLDFDLVQLTGNLKVDYLLSSVQIMDEKLELNKLFLHQDSAWDIYLYSIK
jgi:hypothetical protein